LGENAQAGEAMKMPKEEVMIDTAKSASNPSEQSCGCMDNNIHTSVSADSCPVDSKLYGDVNDPQVRDAKVEFLENKNIEAEPAAKKDHGELMPGKPDLETAKKAAEGPAVETKVMEGFSNLKGVNKAEEKNGEYKYSLDVPNKPETITDKGDGREKNFDKEGEKDLLQKCPGNGTASIPVDLMPMFQEFLQQKGIKLEPEVENEEIEEPMEKTLYVDSDISEMDLKQLSDGDAFDFAQMLGKAATQKLRLQTLNTKMRLAKNLKVADIEYIVDSEPKKNLII
jgi:hypothetical protein